MSSTNWSSYAATAKEHSGGPNIPEGTGYTGKIIAAKVNIPKSGKPRFSWQFQILTGPHAGKSEFLTQTLSVDNGVALSIFRRVLLSLGIDMDTIPDGTPHEAVAQLAVGRTFTFDIEHKASGDFTNVNFKQLTAVETVTSAPVMSPVVSAPVAEAPQVTEAAAPAAAPDLAAQLAALQAQIAQQDNAAVAAPATGSKLPW